MLQTTNPAGYIFKWPDGSEYVEVYHPHDPYPDIPLVAVKVDFRHDLSTLNKYANETADWSRYVE